MATVGKARVFRNGRSQAVRIPAEYRFKTDEVYLRHNPATGELILSEQLPRPSLEEIFAEFDAAGGADFEIERDLSLPLDREPL